MSNWCLNLLISGNMSWKFLTISRITNKTGPGYHKSPSFTPLSSECLYSTWCYTSITWNIQTVPAGHWTLSCCFPLWAQDGAVTFCANIQQVSWSSWSQKISNSRGMYSETLHRKKKPRIWCANVLFFKTRPVWKYKRWRHSATEYGCYPEAVWFPIRNQEKKTLNCSPNNLNTRI